MSHSFAPLEDSPPIVFPSKSLYPKIYRHFGDDSKDGHRFWQIWNDKNGIRDAFKYLWDLKSLIERGAFDIETKTVDGLHASYMKKVGDSYEVSVFITTPELTERVRNAIKNRQQALVVSQSHHHSPGCSNAGKYRDVPEEFFCGPEGGACAGTFPVDTPGRWKSALGRAHFAPNPEGIKECANRIAMEQGWKK